MVTNKTKKNKKVLTTTLGKAPNHSEVINDLSQLLKPIDTSLYGTRQVLAIFQKGTDEVKNYLTFECDILFECRICRSIFRSLANFILHKRNYCQDRFHTVNCFREDEEDAPSTVEKSNEVTEEEVSPEQVEKTALSVVIEKLKEKQNIKDLSERILKEDLSTDSQNNKHEPKRINNNILFEKIASNNAAVFQTVLENLPKKSIIRPDLMKSEVMEIHGILDKNEAVLAEDGKVTEFETNKLDRNSLTQKNSLVCSECNLKFSTKKTLTYHLKYKHNNSRLVYICPECKDSFANAWSVFRHLLKVHRKTHTQVKRLRHQVHNSVVRRDEGPSRKKQLKQDEKIADDENQWLDNIEGDKDFQMCGGCGKRFERKAALHSHVQMCTKRMAVCNTIKENNAKKKDEESKDSKNKATRPEDKVTSPKKREGASKRKPYSLRTYKPGGDPVVVCVDIENENTGSELPISNCDIEVIPNVEFSDEFNEMNSPIRSTSAMTPLLETIDTEKMLSIIGIPESHLKVSQQKSPENTTVETAAAEIEPDPENLPVTIGKVAPQVTEILDIDVIKTEKSNTTYSAMDLDSFCSKNIETIDISDEDENLLDAPVKEETSTNKTSKKVEVSPSSRSSKRKTRMRKRKRSSTDMRNAKLFKLSEEYVSSTDIEYIQRAEPYMDPDRLKCNPCQLEYETITELIWHMSAHFSWFRYQCSQCSFISWSRKACRRHAVDVHNVNEDNLNGVVLEIPDWKIGLMTHSFRELLVEDLDLNGRHTDEVIVVSEEEDIVIKEEVMDSGYENAQYSSNSDILFSETDRLESSDDDSYRQSNTRTDSIDVVDGDNDLFIVEVPEEIVPQCIEKIEYYQRIRLESPQLTSKDEFIPDENVASVVDKEMSIASSDTESNDMTQQSRLDNINEVPELDNIETSEVIESNAYSCDKGDSQFIRIQPSKDSFAKSMDNLPMVRSTRTRIPSIKTSQMDFLYDLNGVIKMNNSTANSKQKKIISGSNHLQRNLKEPDSNTNSKSMKVCVNK